MLILNKFICVIQLPVNDELVWDNGTAFPEPCIDRIADTVGKVKVYVSSISFLFGENMNHLHFSLYYIELIQVTVDFQYEALGWLCGGLGFFATLGLMATLNDKASKIPFVSHLILYQILLLI